MYTTVAMQWDINVQSDRHFVHGHMLISAYIYASACGHIVDCSEFI